MRLFRPMLSLAAGAWCSSAAATPAATSPDRGTSCGATRQWQGFAAVKYVFSFGDSYTTTEFQPGAAPSPSPDNPLGNPAYPGRTSANGPNWIDYLTVAYNASLLQTYNLAVGGATVDPSAAGAPSLRDQVEGVFVPTYGTSGAGAAPGWTGQDSLFTIWIGINDVNGAYARGPGGPNGTDVLNKAIVASYAQLVQTLRSHGARNFVLLNVPAIERSPLTTAQGAEAVALEGADLKQFNALVRTMAAELKGAGGEGKKVAGEGVNFWVYDSYADFNTVIDRPATFPQTARYKNTTEYCLAYESLWM